MFHVSYGQAAQLETFSFCHTESMNLVLRQYYYYGNSFPPMEFFSYLKTNVKE